MKFEKLSEYKLRVTVSNDELLESSNGDLDNFMSNPSKARKSFLEILDKAEDEVGFHIDNSRIRIDAKSMYNGDFIFTITKLIPKSKAILSICSTNVWGKLIDICVIPIVFPDPFLRAILLFPFLLVR